MFVEYSTMVEANISEVEKRFDEIRSGEVTDVKVIHPDGDELVARVGPTSGIARNVKLDIGRGSVQSSGLVYPVHWMPTSAEALFPELTADLTLAHAGRGHTRLTIQGTYQPPLGAIGRLADRAFLGRLAEATVANLMDRLAAALSEQPSTS
jgi:hypothetical protein